jgi:signal transduction histidine kinase
LSQENEMSQILELRELALSNDIDINDRIIYSKQASELSYKLGVDSTILKSNRVLSYVYLINDDYPDFAEINHVNLKDGLKLKDSISIAYALHNLAWYHDVELNKDSSYFYYYNARKIFSDLKDKKNEGSVLLNMAYIQKDEKDYIGAEENAIQAIKLLESLPKNQEILDNLWSLNNLVGLISERLENREKAIEYFNKTIEISKKIENSRYYYLSSINNLALTIERQGNLKSALELYKEVVEDEQLLNVDTDLYVIAIGNVARMEFAIDSVKADYSKSILFNTLKITDSLDDTVNEMGIYGFLADIYDKTGKQDSALYFSKKAYDLAIKTKSNVERMDALKLMAKLDGGTKGIGYLNEHIRLSDSLLNKERNIRNKFARIEFETDRIQTENQQLSKERQIFLLSSVGLLVLLFLLYIIISQRSKNKELEFAKKQQEANEEIYNLMLAQQEKVDEGRTQEKKRISEELHDGVLGKLFGTRLSLDSLNMVQTDEAVKTRSQYINELKNIEIEIRKISHDLNSDFISGTGFIDIIKKLIDTQSLAYQYDYKFTNDNSIDWEELPNKTKIHIYRMLQECMQNIYKHANASLVKISFQLKNNVILLTIEDNGSGFNINKAKRGIGLKNIDSRVSDIKGKAEVFSKIDIGTKIKISIPAHN